MSTEPVAKSAPPAEKDRPDAPPEVEFPNFWSRLILSSQIKKQFPVAPLPRPGLRWMLKGLERLVRPNVREFPLDRPIFLIGMHRSGTTMLQNILCAHPDVGFITNAMNGNPDSPCAVDKISKLLRINLRTERYLRDGVEIHAHGPNEGIIFWQRWLKEDPYSCEYPNRKLADFTTAELAAMRDSICRIVRCFGSQACRFFSKNPRLVPYVGLLGEMFPDGKFIHIVRDPRRCAASMLKGYEKTRKQLEMIRANGGHGIYDKQPFIPAPRLPRLAEYMDRFGLYDIRTMAHLWNDGVTYIRETKPELSSVIEVRYEDIVTNPREALQRVLDFCELPPVADRNSLFWQELSQVAPRPSSAPSRSEEVIDSICADNMHIYGYH